MNPGRTDKLSENSREGRSRDKTGSGGSEGKSSIGRGYSQGVRNESPRFPRWNDRRLSRGQRCVQVSRVLK